MDDFKIYVLKEYDDGAAYGEESIQVFTNVLSAEEKLKKDFCKWAQLDEKDWKNAPQLVHASKDDTFEHDYISLTDWKGNCHFFVIEEKTLDPREAAFIFDKVEKNHDRQDAQYILDEYMDRLDLEISSEEQEKIINESVAWFRNNHDWNVSDYDQLNNCVQDCLEERGLMKSWEGMSL